MLDLQIVTSFVYENFENVSISKNGTHFHARCLLCGDSKISLSKKRFHLDWKNGSPVWKCWNCGRSGNFVQIFSLVKGIPEAEARKILFKFTPEKAKNRIKNLRKKLPQQKQLIPDKTYNWILDECGGDGLNTDAALYPTWDKIIKKFRKDRDIPDKYKVYYAFTGKYSGRLIIPIHDKYGDIVFFQARRKPGSEIKPKYKNPPESKNVILNQGAFRRDLFIIVTEGIIDAFMIGNQGTTCLGKEISEDFLSRIIPLTGKGVIIAFDNDKDGLEALHKFMLGKKKRKNYTPPNPYRKRVRYFFMPSEFSDCKDINILRTQYKIDNMYEFVKSNSYDYLKAKLRLSRVWR